MNSLIARLIAIFTAGIIIILIGIAVGYTTLYERNTNEQLDRYLQETAKDTVQSLRRYLDDLENSAQSMTQQKDICDFAAGDINTRFKLRDTVRSYLSAYANYKTGIMTVYFTCKDGAWLSASPEDANAYLSEMFLVYLHAVQSHDTSTPFRATRLSSHYTSNSGEARYFSLLVPVYRLIAAPKDSDYLGAFVIICDNQSLTSVLPNSSSERIVLYDGDQCFYGKENLPKEGNEGAASEKWPVPNTDWTVSVLRTQENEHSHQLQPHRFVILMTVVSVLVLGGLLLYTYLAFIHPVVSISKQVQSISDIAGRITYTESRDPVFSQLVQTINQTLERLEQATQEATTATTLMYQERLLFLQAQINPHFLYNNLACIRGMAGQGDLNSIRQMTTCIADIYRYGSAGETTATLEEEIDCALRYMEIMELRYDKRYTLQLEIEDNCRSWIVPRMVLQPLIENSILHGYLDAHIQAGIVKVCAYIEEEKLVLLVQDEGGGFSDDAMTMLQGKGQLGRQPPHHLGIRNVRARLQLLFNGQAGFDALSDKHAGATVRIVIPKN